MNLEQYARTILTEEAYTAVQARIDAKLLKAFRLGDANKREQIAALLNANDVFMSELRLIIAEAAESVNE